MNITGEIRRYIEKNKIQQRMLAQRAGMTESALSLTLNGKRKLLAEEYIRICDALCVSSYGYFVSKRDRK